MRKQIVMLLPLALLCLTGCESHLVFIEEDHLGLKAQFQPNNPSPAQITLGYRRGLIAVIPQQSQTPQTLTNSVTVNTVSNTVTIVENPNELMSLYTVFHAKVGFNSPIEVHQFMATGMAANTLLANHDDLRDLSAVINGTSN